MSVSVCLCVCVSVCLFKLYRDFHDFALYHSNRSLKNSNSPVPGKPYPPMLVAEDTLEPLGVHARRAAMGEAVAVHVSWSPDNASDIEKLLQRKYEEDEASVCWRSAGAGGAKYSTCYKYVLLYCCLTNFSGTLFCGPLISSIFH